MKSGWRTTEFWLALLAAVVGAVLSTGVVAGTPWERGAGVAAVALSALGYSVSRGLTKGGGK